MFSFSLRILCIVILFHHGKSRKEEECVEVGFARTSHLNVEQSYQLAKETLLPIWEKEDLTNTPKYSGLSPQIKNVTRSSKLLEETTKNILALIRKTRVGKRCPENWLMKGMEKHVMPLIQLDKELAESLGLVMSFRCLVGSPYPNVDGTCVNEEGPDQGAIGAKFLRLMPPTAAKDGFSFRVSVQEGRPLPTARKVAQLIRKHLPKLPASRLLTEWSHFIYRDTASIPESPLLEDVDCCSEPDVEDCAPIFLDQDDPDYSSLKCINFKRSIRAQAIIGHRESLSVVSTYLDANPVYGATNEEAFTLKEGYFGYLKFPKSLDKELNERDTSKCQFPKSFEGCFGLDSSDDQFAENLHLLLLMEHNRIADMLADINPHFDDSLLYNEARRISIAQYNAIIFGQFLPTLIGKEIVEKHNMHPGAEGPGANFIPEVNPGVLASFALSAFRNPSMEHEWRGGNRDNLKASQFNSVRNDKYVDILAMEIQRARDHGLPSYGSWRSFCDGGNNIESWEDLKKIFSDEIVKDLEELYQGAIEDLDMSVALLEPAEEGAVIGKIHSCILVDQYARLRTGNRLFWEHDSSMLSVEQRDSIKAQQSAADLLCRHFQLKKVLSNPFLLPSESNPEIECKDVPTLDIKPWVDVSLIEVMKQKKEEDMKKLKEEKEAAMKQIEEEKAAKKQRKEEALKQKEEEALKQKEEEALKQKEEEALKRKEEEKEAIKQKEQNKKPKEAKGADSKPKEAKKDKKIEL